MKQITLFRTKRKAMRANKKGGIEGLPLQLLIIIVVASLGLAIMVGWMNSIEEPDMIDSVETSYEKSGDTYDITVRVLDKDGYGVEGADVILTGYGAYTIASTNTTVQDTGLVLAGNVYVDGVYYKDPTPLSRASIEASGYNPDNYPAVTVTQEDAGEKTTPHGVTDSEGYATITVHFDSLKTYGTLNVEVTKAGYTGNSVSMKVFA